MKSHVWFLSIRLCLPALLIATATPGRGEGKQLPTVVVAKTEAQRIAYWQPAMGEGLAQMIITELNKLDNMSVLESVGLDDLREERKLGETGEVSAGEAVKKGQWKGADYTFKTVLTRFGSKDQNYGGGGGPALPGVGRVLGNFSVRKSENEVQIDWHIVDNATRQLVKGASGSAVGVEKGSGFNFGSWGGHGFSGDREFMDSALGKATVKAVTQIVEAVKKIDLAPGARSISAAADEKNAQSALRKIRGNIELVDGKEIWVSLGSKNGFAKGDKVKLYQPVEKKNAAGKVVLTTFKEAGEIELTKVQKDKSMGIYTGNGTISEGWSACDAAIDIETIE